MAIKTAWIVNANAKGNKGRRAVNKERRALENKVRILQDPPRIDVTTTPDDVRILCDEYIDSDIQIIGLSGGDGTVQKFLTEHFKQLYRKFGKGNTPITFAQMMNEMALNPDSRLSLPAAYHRKKGTLNFYADTLGMNASIDTILDNISNAETWQGTMGTRIFRRVYVPILMLYDKDNPNDLEHVELMGMYADGLVYNFFDEYYRPQKKGKDSSMLTAAQVVARSAGSVALEKILPRDGRLGQMFPERYIDRILQDVKGEVVADGDIIIPAGNVRKAMALGVVNASLYGLKPFYRMARTEQEFKNLGLYFEPLEMEELSKQLEPRNHYFHMLTGDADPADIVRAIPQILRGRKTGIPGMVDRMVKKVDITQDEDLHYIADGGTMKDGRRIAIEIAYLQPFILLDKRPMD